MKVLDKIGAYILFMGRIFTKPEKKKVYLKELTNELEKLGLNSVMLVMIISFFIGAVLTLQTAYNMSSPLLPRYLIGYLTRETLLLEFSSTIVSLILAGKIGSNIASEIGSMKITEQIEALEVMGSEFRFIFGGAEDCSSLGGKSGALYIQRIYRYYRWNPFGIGIRGGKL